MKEVVQECRRKSEDNKEEEKKEAEKEEGEKQETILEVARSEEF